MSCCVYKHTFPNGKVYIGITGNKPELRWGKNGNGYKTQLLMANAIEKYGWENVSHEILYSGLSEKGAIQKEEELIEKYQSYKDEFGYNIKRCGCVNELSRKKGTAVRCIETNVIYSSIREAERETNIQSGGISSVCRGKTDTAGGCHWEFIDDGLKERSKTNVVIRKHLKTESKKYKAVRVRCVETGIVYSSVRKAEKMTNICGASILKNCRGKIDTAGGCHWEFADNNSKIIANKNKTENRQNVVNKNKTGQRKFKPVRCVETGVIYHSITEAQRMTGITNANISASCRGVNKTAGGYHWEYVDTKDICIEETLEKAKKKNVKTIRCIETGEVYESAQCVYDKTGISRSSISRVCKGKQKTAGGFHWEFVDEPTH